MDKLLTLEPDITKGFIELGVAGAALLIILVFVVLLFKLFSNVNKRENNIQNNRIDRLCDKIDNLVSCYAQNTEKLNQVLLSNDRDQKNMLKTLTRILDAELEIQRKVERIDVRTKQIVKDSREG